MRILHTADLHLKGREHINVLETIIYTANRESVDLIIVAGDLFDMANQGRDLENALLPIWEKFSGEVLIIPGNHDLKYLNNRSELASNVIVANTKPYSVALIDHIYFVCVPYQADVSLSDISIPRFDPAILIAHGTYGKTNSYFPIFADDIAGRYQYAALGHYHTWFDRWEDGTLIVNPGAPRQTRKTDKGLRFVALIDTDTWMMERITLPISYVEYKTVHLSVIDSPEEVAEKLLNTVRESQNNSHCETEIVLQGGLLYSQYSLSECINRWNHFLSKNGIDLAKIRWNTDKLTQISPKILYSSFGKLLVDKIVDSYSEELNELAPFLFERLQQENINIL
ncbi:MAG: metallophosphoesterase family protein [Brevinema sp.]